MATTIEFRFLFVGEAFFYNGIEYVKCGELQAHLKGEPTEKENFSKNQIVAKV